jgi:hypothetical protein
LSYYPSLWSWWTCGSHMLWIHLSYCPSLWSWWICIVESLFLAHLTQRVMWAIAITWRLSSSSFVNFFKNLLLWKY